MRIYRGVWGVVCIAVVGVGVGVGVIQSPATLAATFLTFAVLAAIATFLSSRFRKRRVRVTGRRLVVSAAAGGSAAGAFVGLGEVLGVGVLTLAVLLISASPHVLRAYVRALTSLPVSVATGLGSWMSPPAPVSPQEAQIPAQRTPIRAAPDVRLVSDQRLRGVWRTSYLVLQTRPCASEVMAIVEERQRYLDDFERRNPEGFEAWLAVGASASNIPVRYLRRAPATQSEIDWDELTGHQEP